MGLFQSSLGGSSPLSRGIPYDKRRTMVEGGIIPALAGNTPFPTPLCHPEKDHPRSRGEYLLTLLSPPRCQGSSPLSRGIPTRRVAG